MFTHGARRNKYYDNAETSTGEADSLELWGRRLAVKYFQIALFRSTTIRYRPRWITPTNSLRRIKKGPGTFPINGRIIIITKMCYCARVVNLRARSQGFISADAGMVAVQINGFFLVFFFFLFCRSPIRCLFHRIRYSQITSNF